MSPRRGDEWWTPGPKKPPPAHGIRIKKAGTTWWGQRWLEALEHALGADAGRLARGRTYARAGRTHDLTVDGGTVTAKVTGSRASPYEVVIRLAELGQGVWQRAIDGMAAKAQFSAELLAGQMPQGIDEVFRADGLTLFPSRRAELSTSCSCPDWGDPCKHVAATHYVLGEALDRDPFLLFELRGRTKSQVLEALRAARDGGPAPADVAPGELAISAVKLSRQELRNYDEPRTALPTLHFAFDEPATHGSVLRQLGSPATWPDAASPVDLLVPVVRAAAENARRVAMAEVSDAEPLPPPAPAPPRKKSPAKRTKPRAAR